EIRTGSAAWTHPHWRGRVYPESLGDHQLLKHYSTLWDFVEVDSSYYSVPSLAMAEGWRKKTPPGFVFAMKFPRDFLHPRARLDLDLMYRFFEAARALGDKLGPILLQFSPGVDPRDGREFLPALFDQLEMDLRYVVELRETSWFDGENLVWLRKELKERSFALCWSYLTYVEVPPEVTTDFVYARFMGDHETLKEKDLGELRLDRSDVMDEWAARIKVREDDVSRTFLVFSDQFEGFAPESMNRFRVKVGMPEVDFRGAAGSRAPDRRGPTGRASASRKAVGPSSASRSR
ncbi:MAG TPA: DUF72 domain-containing protein, partial [Thermoplasmata archaeon]|nr:DUF72 domain-containing protein [Thermoplasmata archaeon]